MVCISFCTAAVARSVVEFFFLSTFRFLMGSSSSSEEMSSVLVLRRLCRCKALVSGCSGCSCWFVLLVVLVRRLVTWVLLLVPGVHGLLLLLLLLLWISVLVSPFSITRSGDTHSSLTAIAYKIMANYHLCHMVTNRVNSCTAAYILESAYILISWLSLDIENSQCGHEYTNLSIPNNTKKPPPSHFINDILVR